MFDIGWPELLIIALITIIVVGPKELPKVLRTVTLAVRKVRGMAREFQDGLDDLAREAELKELREEIEQSADVDLENQIEGALDSTGEVGETVRELEETFDEDDPFKQGDGSEEPADAPADAPAVVDDADAKKADGAT
jgi:sec-independent protein translocase protein TatB